MLAGSRFFALPALANVERSVYNLMVNVNWF